MAQEWATGAVHIFVNTPLSDTPEYLGTSEQGPQRQTDRTFKQVMNDLSSQKPFDYVYAGGEEAILSFVLTRWNDDTAQDLERSPFEGGLGFCSIFDQGALMGQEGFALQIWYVYTFGGLAARPAYLGQEGCRHYHQALFWGPEQDTLGSTERKKHMVFKCWKKFDAATKRFTLFDFALPSPMVVD